MRSKGRFLRRLVPGLAATLLGLSGVGLVTAAPAAADANMSIALTVTTPLTGAAANTLYVGQKATYAVAVTAASALTQVSFSDKLPAGLTADQPRDGMDLHGRPANGTRD
jgi:uncharacterized repeat protein (TIGR01451 family)